jgi:hypothetical protein
MSDIGPVLILAGLRDLLWTDLIVSGDQVLFLEANGEDRIHSLGQPAHHHHHRPASRRPSLGHRSQSTTEQAR